MFRDLVIERIEYGGSAPPFMPWERCPVRLWSRLEMKPFPTAEIARAIANIATARGNASAVPIAKSVSDAVVKMLQDQLALANVHPRVVWTHEDAVGEGIRPRVLELLDAAERGLADAALPQRFAHKICRLREHIRDDIAFDGIDARARLEELLYDLLHELTEPQFLRIPPEKRRYFEPAGPLFGEATAEQFPESSGEIGAAGRCYAVGEWTACVFHLMRALELALHKWARELDVTQFAVLELENWKNILDAADKKVRSLEQQTKGLQKDHDLQYYGETCAHFRAIKDAWRNHVSHSRTSYDEREADSIMMHVNEFMRLLANRP